MITYQEVQYQTREELEISNKVLYTLDRGGQDTKHDPTSPPPPKKNQNQANKQTKQLSFIVYKLRKPSLLMALLNQSGKNIS